MNEFIKRIVTTLVLVSSIYCLYLLPPLVLSAVLLGLLVYVLVIEWPILAQKTRWLWGLTPLYPILPFCLLSFLNYTHQPLLLLLVLMVCSHDIGAYIHGKVWGKHKIAPKISPGKSWEGFIGGFFTSMVVTCTVVSFSSLGMYLKHFSTFSFLLFIFLINSVALAGDLWESYLKRRAGIKDSGSLLPGHGGILDRFDSLLFAVIIGIIYFLCM